MPQNTFHADAPNPKAIKWDAIFTDGAKYKSLNEVFISDLLDQFDRTVGRQPAAIIDLGCGSGDVLQAFSGRGFSVIGVDVSAVAISQAREKLENASSRSTLIVHDLDQIQSLQIESPESSLWICKFVLAFMSDQLGFLKNVYTLMKSGDQFLVMTSVMREGIQYTPENKPSISIKIDLIQDLLTEVFHDYIVFSNEYMGERGRIVSFLVQKK